MIAAMFILLLSVFIPAAAMAKSLFEHQETAIPETQTNDLSTTGELKT